MSELNGVPKRHDPETAEDIRDWVIAYVNAESGWVGKPTGVRDEWPITLCPAFSYDAVTQTQQKGDSVTHGRMRRVLPAEMMASDVTISCRPHSMLFLGDLDKEDLEFFFRDFVQPVLKTHSAIRAQRAGIVTASSLDLAGMKRPIRG